MFPCKIKICVREINEISAIKKHTQKFDIISDGNNNNLSNDIARHIIKIDETTDEDDDIFNTSFVAPSLLTLSTSYGHYSKSLNDIYSQDIPQNSFMTQAGNVSTRRAVSALLFWI